MSTSSGARSTRSREHLSFSRPLGGFPKSKVQNPLAQTVLAGRVWGNRQSSTSRYLGSAMIFVVAEAVKAKGSQITQMGLALMTEVAGVEVWRNGVKGWA